MLSLENMQLIESSKNNIVKKIVNIKSLQQLLLIGKINAVKQSLILPKVKYL